jgi:hypothetical protein
VVLLFDLPHSLARNRATQLVRSAGAWAHVAVGSKAIRELTAEILDEDVLSVSALLVKQMSRLIESPAAERQLLAAITAQPEGAKLSIPRLRDALLNQGDVLGALQRMVADGRIDAQRLRPVKRKQASAPGICPATNQHDLCSTRWWPKRADAALRSRRLASPSGTIRRGSTHCATLAQPCAMQPPTRSARGLPTNRRKRRRRGSRRPRCPGRRLPNPPLPSSLPGAKRGHIASSLAPASPAIKGPCRICHAKPSTSPAVEALAPEKVTGASLAAEIDALIERTGANRGRVSNLLFDSGTGIERLREARRPKAETVEKVRLFLDHPPADLFAAPALSRRDPTQKPDTPLMDAADRQRLNGQRHHAANKRASESVAAKLVDAGADPSKQNSMVGSQMREIQRRRAEEARQADPVEQAKVALQRKGRSVYAADVAGGRPGHFHISGKRDPSGRLLDLTPAALIAEAERVTGQIFRRAG